MDTVIRAYEDADEGAVRRIAFETALAGRPMAPWFDDERLISEALLGYYLRCERQSLFVAARGSDVVGYLSGCLDTRRFEARYAACILPRVLGLWVGHGHGLRGRGWRLLAGSAVHARLWTSTRAGLLGAYPAHLHLNLDASARGAGVGGMLLESFCDYARKRGCPGVHVTVGSSAGARFFARAGFERVEEKREKLVFTGEPVVMSLMTLSLEDRDGSA